MISREAAVSAPLLDSRWALAALIVAVFALRVLTLSQPYYVDGPNHIRAIADGSLFIQPPGYFLFGLSARGLASIFRLSPAAAVSALNIAFSLAGVLTFRAIAARLFPGSLGFVLTCAYAFANVVWFAAEIHSTYASVTFFAPLLFYFLGAEMRLQAAWITWAMLAGFRPSDGVFLLPCMVYASVHKPRRELVWAFLPAIAICAIWYLPTAFHFGGAIAPLFAANRQLGQLPSGFLAQGFTPKAWNNLLHFAFGASNTWNVLLPFVMLGAFFEHPLRRLTLIWLFPAAFFYAAYFISDSLYFAALAPAGFVLAGFALRRFLSARAAAWTVLLSVLWELIHMLVLRPVPVRSVPTAVINSYVLEYSGWALKHRYAKRLARAIEELREGEGRTEPPIR